MDEKGFKELVKKLEEVNAVITKLDPAIRSEAFSLLKPYLGTRGSSHGGSSEETTPDGGDTDDAEAFFTKHPEGKPADNAVLAAGYLYSQYGSQAFSLAEVREVADAAGITIPQHLNMTFKQSRRKGKGLFQHVGKNQFKPTVHGEAYFKGTLSAKKGTKSRKTSEES
ncbi:MAG: hypothetical protein LAO03_02935 [Acidobacteriia bacterium]|nr:hypothetical protein [Terriglobia bacterium]